MDVLEKRSFGIAEWGQQLTTHGKMEVRRRRLWSRGPWLVRKPWCASAVRVRWVCWGHVPCTSNSARCFCCRGRRGAVSIGLVQTSTEASVFGLSGPQSNRLPLPDTPSCVRHHCPGRPRPDHVDSAACASPPTHLFFSPVAAPRWVGAFASQPLFPRWWPGPSQGPSHLLRVGLLLSCSSLRLLPELTLPSWLSTRGAKLSRYPSSRTTGQAAVPEASPNRRPHWAYLLPPLLLLQCGPLLLLTLLVSKLSRMLFVVSM